MAAKKKVKEVTGVYNPFWTGETIETFGSSSLRGFASRYPVTIMDYSNDTHLPFYVLPKINSRYIDNIHYQLLGSTPESIPRIATSTSSPVKVTDFIKGLWESKRYEHFMIAMEARAANASIALTGLVSSIKSKWNDTLSQPIDTAVSVSDHTSCTGALNIIKCAKMGSHFGLGKIHSKAIRSGPWAHPQYLFGRYFIAHLVDVAGTGHQAFPHGGSNNETMFVPVPLMSLMFKIEHINLLRGYMLNNKEVPAELMELWVDEELNKLDSPHPIRLQYQRNIRKPLEAAGVTVKIVKNLDGMLFNRMAPPKFKSIRQQYEWRSGIVQTIMDSERMVNGIVTKKQLLDKSLDAIFSSVKPEPVPDKFRKEFMQGVNI